MGTLVLLLAGPVVHGGRFCPNYPNHVTAAVDVSEPWTKEVEPPWVATLEPHIYE